MIALAIMLEYAEEQINKMYRNKKYINKYEYESLIKQTENYIKTFNKLIKIKQ